MYLRIIYIMKTIIFGLRRKAYTIFFQTYKNIKNTFETSSQFIYLYIIKLNPDSSYPKFQAH